MPPTLSDLEAMVAAGASAQVLLLAVKPLLLEAHAIVERDTQRRERHREQSHKRVTRYRALRNALLREQRLLKKERKKALPSIEEPNGSSISDRAKRKPKVPLPDDFNPVISITDGEELERFKDHARSTARLCADWNAAWRNWLRSPYRKPNGAQANGHSEPDNERVRELREMYRIHHQKLRGKQNGTGRQGVRQEQGTQVRDHSRVGEERPGQSEQLQLESGGIRREGPNV